ncbi:MAG: hypothetical protein SVU32_06550 [Candidatus Nanohaloarchaea archaeon]|nr:hypothetical protein [Candidatus Nanohaloarchaea archaeon]
MMEPPGDWKRVARREWILERGSLSGEARIREVEGGFKASIEVEDVDFGMRLLEEEEFFQPEREAREFVRRKMEEV